MTFRPSLRSEAVPLGCLGAVFVLLALLFRPWSMDFPLNDDWAYLIPAKRLAHEGVLRLSDWGTPTQVLHVLWGALWTWLLGWDMGWLKVSTLLWSAAGAMG